MKFKSAPITKNRLINTDLLVVFGFAFLYPATSGFTSIMSIIGCFIIMVVILSQSLSQHLQYYKLTHKIY